MFRNGANKDFMSLIHKVGTQFCAQKKGFLKQWMKCQSCSQNANMNSAEKEKEQVTSDKSVEMTFSHRIGKATQNFEPRIEKTEEEADPGKES